MQYEMKVKGKKIYVKCTGGCDEENTKCVLFIAFDEVGKVLELGCKCETIEFDHTQDPQVGCVLEWTEKKEGKRRTFYYQCKNDRCDKDCIFWFEQKDGGLADKGCECISWNSI